MPEFVVRPLQLKKLVERVEAKRKIFDAANDIARGRGEGQKAPTIESRAQWYIEASQLLDDLPMHNQRVTLTDEDYKKYFTYLYYDTTVVEKYIADNTEEE